MTPVFIISLIRTAFTEYLLGVRHCYKIKSGKTTSVKGLIVNIFWL